MTKLITSLPTSGFLANAAGAATINFDDDTPGAPPRGWSATKTGKGQPKWTVEQDDSAPSKPNVIKQSGEATYPVCLKNDTSLKDMTMCNIESTKGPIASAPGKSKLMVPGSEVNSLLWLRMNVDTPEKGRMPQIATYAIDTGGLAVVGDWLKSVPACP